PGVDVGVDGGLDLGVEAGAETFGVVDEELAQAGDADALDEVVGPLLVLGVLAVELDEAGHVGEDLLVGIDHAEDVALADARAGGAAEVDLPLAALDRDRAEVLGGGLGAVAGAAGGGQLHLVRGLDALEAALDLDAEADAVAEPVAAELGADAGLAGAEGFGVGVAGGHTELLPDGGQLLAGNAQEIDALTAGDLDHAHAVALGGFGDA